MKVLAARTTVVLVACAALGALFAPAAAATDVYAFANGCYALRDAGTGRFVVKDALGYAATATTAARRHALPHAGHRPRPLPALRARRADAERRRARPGLADRHPGTGGRLARDADERRTLRLTNVSTGRHLGVGALGRLVQVAAPPPLVVRARPGCATFPEVEVNATGTPFKGASPTARVRGFLDDHIHIGAFEFLGGRFHCGRPWSPYGVTVALKDCVDHEPNGAGAVAENFFATGSPVGHPRHRRLADLRRLAARRVAHPRGHLLEVDRAGVAAGLRIMVNDLVENRALCELYPLKQNDCNEMDSAPSRPQDMYALQDYIDAQFGGPGKGFLRIVQSPAEARAGDQRGQARDGARRGGLRGPRLRAVQRRAAVQRPRRSTPSSTELHALGVRSVFPVHKFDNALGGTHFDAAPPACSSTPATSTPPASSGRPSTAPRAPTTTTSPPTCPASTRRRSTRCSARC